MWRERERERERDAMHFIFMQVCMYIHGKCVIEICVP